jgi:excisionase family DNA binding protein
MDKRDTPATTTKLTVTSAAARCGVSPFTLRTYLRRGRLPYFKVGRRIVLDSADVDAFLRACRVEAREEAR